MLKCCFRKNVFPERKYWRTDWQEQLEAPWFIQIGSRKKQKKKLYVLWKKLVWAVFLECSCFWSIGKLLIIILPLICWQSSDSGCYWTVKASAHWGALSAILSVEEAVVQARSFQMILIVSQHCWRWTEVRQRREGCHMGTILLLPAVYVGALHEMLEQLAR